jgi:hypothetical protein
MITFKSRRRSNRAHRNASPMGILLQQVVYSLVWVEKINTVRDEGGSEIWMGGGERGARCRHESVAVAMRSIDVLN